MGKRYFANKRNAEPSLSKIILLLLAICAALYAGLYAAQKVYSWAAAPDTPEDAAAIVEEAARLVESGDSAAAREKLAPLADSLTDATLGPRTLLLLARIESTDGNKVEALAHLEHAYKDFPTSPIRHEVTAAYAAALEETGAADQAQSLLENIVESAPPGQQASGLAGLAQQAEREGDLEKARGLYREALEDASVGSDLWLESAEALGRLNIQLIFSPAETSESKIYEVKSGDNLLAIGVTLNTTQGLLMTANGIDDPARLRVGQRLKYTPKNFRIVIERSTCRLFLLDKNGLFKMYMTGLGMPGYETTLGSYTIGNKEKNPTWHKPGSEPIPPLDPENELGTRWMPLVPAEEGLPNDLGIHGTIHPETIGDYKSHGCPRMRKEDVEQLYDLVVRSTPVAIVETFSPPWRQDT